MKIQRTLQDAAGVKVTFKDGASYEFMPLNDFIATVENPEHAARFLSIPEGYREVLTAPAAAPPSPPALVEPPAADPVAEAAAAEAERLAAEQEAQKLAQETALEASRIAAEEAAAQAQSAADQAKSADEQTTPSPEPEGAKALANLTDEELRAAFLAEVGRKAGNRAGRDTMIAQIEATRAAA